MHILLYIWYMCSYFHTSTHSPIPIPPHPRSKLATSVEDGGGCAMGEGTMAAPYLTQR